MPDPAQPPPWFFGRVLQTLVAIVQAILAGKSPSRTHILFLAVTLITLVALVGTILLFFLGQPVYLFATIGAFVLGLLVLFVIVPVGGAAGPGRGGAGGEVGRGEPAPTAGAEAARRPDEVAVREYHRRIEQVAVRCNEIYEHLNQGNPPDVLEERFILTVTPEWDLIASSTVRLRAVQPFLVLLRKLVGEPPVGSFWDLDLHVTATRVASVPRPVIALPAHGTQTNVSVLLFFPPGVPADTELEYTMEWRWPGQWGPLRDDGVDTWAVLARTRKPIDLIRLEFRLPPDRPVALANRGAGGGDLTSTTRGADGTWVYVWECRKVEANQRLIIELRR